MGSGTRPVQTKLLKCHGSVTLVKCMQYRVHDLHVLSDPAQIGVLPWKTTTYIFLYVYCVIILFVDQLQAEIVKDERVSLTLHMRNILTFK